MANETPWRTYCEHGMCRAFRCRDCEPIIITWPLATPTKGEPTWH